MRISQSPFQWSTYTVSLQYSKPTTSQRIRAISFVNAFTRTEHHSAATQPVSSLTWGCQSSCALPDGRSVAAVPLRWETPAPADIPLAEMSSEKKHTSQITHHCSSYKMAQQHLFFLLMINVRAKTHTRPWYRHSIDVSLPILQYALEWFREFVEVEEIILKKEEMFYTHFEDVPIIL